MLFRPQVVRAEWQPVLLNWSDCPHPVALRCWVAFLSGAVSQQGLSRPVVTAGDAGTSALAKWSPVPWFANTVPSLIAEICFPCLLQAEREYCITRCGCLVTHLLSCQCIRVLAVWRASPGSPSVLSSCWSRGGTAGLGGVRTTWEGGLGWCSGWVSGGPVEIRCSPLGTQRGC